MNSYNQLYAQELFDQAISDIVRLGDHDDAEDAVGASQTPNGSFLKALLISGRKKQAPWLQSVEEALIYIGIAGAEFVLERQTS